MKKEQLFTDFSPISGTQWREKIEADLKGADFDRKLVWKTGEGFNLQPYYRQEDLEKIASMQVAGNELPVTRGTRINGNNWKIRQDFTSVYDEATLNKKMLAAVDRGVEAIGINLSGFKSVDENTLTMLFEGFKFEEIEIYFSGIREPLKLYNHLTSVLAKTGIPLSSLKGSLGGDPIGHLACSGECNEQLSDLAKVISLAKEKTPYFKIISIDAGILQNSGSTLSQELGFGLAMGNAYLDKLSDEGLDADTIAAALSFSFACGPNYFMEIAKLRAARWLWSVILKEWGVEKTSMHIHSRSACWNLTIYDPNVNMLRTTTETMSASLGGSDVISVLPFDKKFRDENDFSSRIARNIQVILKEEAYFNKVADPAAGSYYIEQLTESIAEQAWKHFLEVEEKDGFIETFKAVWIQEQVLASAEEKRSKAASRRESILGVNQYPNYTELLLEQGVTIPVKTEIKSTYTPLAPFSMAEEFEALRMQTEKSGKRPKVFLLKYGDPVWMTARAMFSGNFFAVAGYEILDSTGFDTIEAGIEAAKQAEANIVVLCSSDAEYPEIGPTVYDAFKENAEVVIAGYPKDSIEQLQEHGLKHFIHVKTNLLEELRKFQEVLDI